MNFEFEKMQIDLQVRRQQRRQHSARTAENSPRRNINTNKTLRLMLPPPQPPSNQRTTFHFSLSNFGSTHTRTLIHEHKKQLSNLSGQTRKCESVREREGNKCKASDVRSKCGACALIMKRKRKN